MKSKYHRLQLYAKFKTELKQMDKTAPDEVEEFLMLFEISCRVKLDGGS